MNWFVQGTLAICFRRRACTRRCWSLISVRAFREQRLHTSHPSLHGIIDAEFSKLMSVLVVEITLVLALLILNHLFDPIGQEFYVGSRVVKVALDLFVRTFSTRSDVDTEVSVLINEALNELLTENEIDIENV